MVPADQYLDLTLGAQQGFKFAWISDNHLYPKDVNTRFVDKAVRAVKELQAMKPAADFLIHGGDLAELGDPVELDLGNQILQDVKIKKVYIPGSTTGTSTWARSGRSCSASRTGRSITRGSASSGSTP